MTAPPRLEVEARVVEVDAMALAFGAELAKTGNTALFFERMSLMSDIISILLFIIDDEGEDEVPLGLECCC